MVNEIEKTDETKEEEIDTAALIKHMAKMMAQMAEMQTAAMSTSQTLATRVLPQAVGATEGNIHPNPIDARFDGTNYSFWCQAVEMYVRGREKLRHLTGEPAPPAITDAAYHRWATDDVVVKGWLISSLETRLRGNYIGYPTARDVWKSIATTYHDGEDEAHLHALHRQVSQVRQGGRALEEYFNELQKLWQEIDFRSPNPMEYAVDIDKFNLFIQKTRVYTFLDGLDDALDGVRAQIVQI